ncbi:uncharacterized protein VTP21DRAFT_8861 [Calcarisporiella thermophila]|uniref:uncharacterized protein n=1 Tax=Calcarisporiella thermophila TaxID=911321 RepID=UPI0037438F63
MALPQHPDLFVLLQAILEHAVSRTQSFRTIPVTTSTDVEEYPELPDTGMGAQKTIEWVLENIGTRVYNSVGPRYYAFVTGGVTEAALAADWLSSVWDQNAIVGGQGVTSSLEEAAIRLLLSLFGLEENEYWGIFTSGATESNVIGISIGRQLLCLEKFGINVSEDGIDPGRVWVVGENVHSSFQKAASIIGVGRRYLKNIPGMGCGEKGVNALENVLKDAENKGAVCIVIAGFAEVNTGYFPDNTIQIAEVCKRYGAFFHIDAAFGAFARCSPAYEHLAKGLELADTITADGHKWLNVPYDCGLFFYRKQHKKYLTATFGQNAAYLTEESQDQIPQPMNSGVANSRRWRALPAFSTLLAYGRNGYRHIVEENCRFAHRLFEWLRAHPEWYEVLIDQCPLNIVVFCGVPQQYRGSEGNKRLLAAINGGGQVFMSETVWRGRPAIRAAISNWRTTLNDDWDNLQEELERVMRI